MKWLLNLKPKYKLSYILTNISLIFFDSIGFLTPIIIGFLVDSITINNNYKLLFPLSFGLIIFIIIKLLGSYFSLIKLENICHKIVSDLKQKCYANLNKLDYYFFEHNNKGELMTNFTSDMWNIRKHLNYNIKTIGSLLLTFIFSLLYLLTINIPFTLILLTPCILSGYLSKKFVGESKPKYEHLRNLQSHVNNFISDNIEANRVVKTFAKEKSEIKQMTKINKTYMNEDIAITYFEDKFYAKIDFLGYLMSVILLFVGGYLFINNKITLGNLIIFNFYLYNLRSPFIRLSGIINSINKYSIAKTRIQKLLEAKPIVILPGTQELKSLLIPITFKDVRIVYDNKVVLENLNLTIKPHETIAFIGKTGSGKSSIVKLLLGLITPESGEILFGHTNYLEYNIKDIRERIGYVTQSPFLFSDTIYNNIKYGRDNLTKEEAHKYAKIACCNYIENLPNGIDTIIGEKGVGLSGGEKQRLSLARALAVNPDILLLDDITSALDIETEEKINESIASLKTKSTKIIIASKIVSVMNADKIYVLDQGHVIESGTHQELLQEKGYYYDLYNIEKGEI